MFQISARKDFIILHLAFPQYNVKVQFGDI